MAMREFRASSRFVASKTVFGPHGSPVVCIDGFWSDPDSLITLACESVFIDVGSRYPGVRAPAPQAYADALLQATAMLIQTAFGAPPERELDLCAFSIVTTPSRSLRPIQRIPHFDGPERGRIAFVHYLCAPEQGGTSFYRHRATDLCEVTPETVGQYRNEVVAELEDEDPSDSYVTGDTRFFERIHQVDARFNRLIIYKGNALHSGDITDATVLSEDPRQGRLTVNGFGFLTPCANSILHGRV
jgi:hypothetical protein